MKSGATMIAGLAFFILVHPVAAGPARLALFQEHSILHSGVPATHVVALTFDDGPNVHTAPVLAALRRYGVKATFFIVGNAASRHPDILADIARDGHLLANHSATHPRLDATFDQDPNKLLDEIRGVHDQIGPLMSPGDKLFFRAPYGYWRTAHATILNNDPALKHYIGPIYWDVGGDITMSRDGYVMSAADWDCWHLHWSAQTCAKGYLREIRRKDGGVVLMHCTSAQAAELVEAVVPALQEEGYRFVRLDQVPEYRKYENREMGVADATPVTEMLRVSALK